MARYLRWAIYGGAALVAALLIALAWVWIASTRALGTAPDPRPSRLERPSPAQLADAPRQLRVLGCASCHGPKLHGKSFLDLPGVVKLHAPNLTLVAAKASDAQLEQGIRQGIGHDGRPLFVMPSEGYQFLTGAETAALIAAIRAMPRGGREQPPIALRAKGRIGLALGKFRTAPEMVREFRASPLPALGRPFEQGRRIVQINCAECHGAKLQGREIEPGTVAPDLSIAAAYDLDQFRAMLRTGIGPGGKDIGLMGRVAKRDFAHMTDEEIAAVYAYLAERHRRAP